MPAENTTDLDQSKIYRWKERTRYLYLMLDEEHYWKLKIGIAFDPESRRSLIEKRLGRPVSLICVFAYTETSSRQIEQCWHTFFADKRCPQTQSEGCSEWFILDQDDLDFFVATNDEDVKRESSLIIAQMVWGPK